MQSSKETTAAIISAIQHIAVLRLTSTGRSNVKLPELQAYQYHIATDTERTHLKSLSSLPHMSTQSAPSTSCRTAGSEFLPT